MIKKNFIDLLNKKLNKLNENLIELDKLKLPEFVLVGLQEDLNGNTCVFESYDSTTKKYKVKLLHDSIVQVVIENLKIKDEIVINLILPLEELNYNL